MGGTVAVTLRKPDGTEYRMDRWTNSMPWGITNMGMLKHDEKHIAEYLQQWLEMQADYEKNKEHGQFEQPMTDAYFPSEGLAPCGYGLVVVDMVNNVILDMQGYSSFDTIGAASVSLDLPHNINDIDSTVTRFKEFFDAGQVLGAVTRNSWDKGIDYEPITMSWDELIAELGSDIRNIFEFKLDLNPFTYERFEEGEPQELIRYRARLLELGFELTVQENEVWANAIDEAIEEYGEDELETNT